MSFTRNGQVLHISATVLYILFTVRSSEETTSIESNTCKIKEIQYRLGTAIDFANNAMESLKVMNYDDCCSKPEDCSVLFSCGQKSNGVYTLWPKNRIMDNSIQAYCDMETDGGGWTVIQRRGDFGRAEDYFYRDWDAYKKGFGHPAQDFWIGNDNLFAISNQKKYSIRFDLKDWENNVRWATYDSFWIDAEENNYTLHVSGYRGDATDSFSYHSGKQFSTKDRDNDGTCAVTCSGAWWYGGCYNSNLNALYLNGYHADRRYKGINWYYWRHDNYSLSFTEMKLKPVFSDKVNSGERSVIPD